MNRKITTLFIALFIFISCKSPYYEKIVETDKFITDLKQRGETAGLACTISIDSVIVFSKGYGIAHLEQRIPASPHKTKFRIGSTSKALTSAALGILLQEGRLELDKSVRYYLSFFPEKRWDITVRQLAGHLSGLRHYREMEFLSDKNYSSVREGLEVFINDPLLHEPGESFSYSSYGWNLLSAVIESAADTSFLDYMDMKVFKPMGMINTIADMNDSIIVNRAGFYGMSQGRIINAAYVDNSIKWAGGGFISTTEDLVRFGNAILYNKLFSRQIRDTLTTTQKTNSGEETGYGIGWYTGINDFERRFFGHGGGSIGGCGNLIIFPRENLVIAYYTNDTRAPVGDEIHELAEIFLRKITNKQ